MKLIKPQAIPGTYGVLDAPVFGTLEFTSDFPSRDGNDLNTAQAFETARHEARIFQRDVQVQSLGHAIVARVAFYNDNKDSKKGWYRTNEPQKTSTVSLKFKDANEIFTAFIELGTDGQSLALVWEMYDAERHGRELLKPLDNPLVSRLVQIARDNKRICPAVDARPLKLSTSQKNGRSDYGQNPNIIAVIGNVELAELNAAYLQERGAEHGCLWTFTRASLENILARNDHEFIPADHALIQPVGLGGINSHGHIGYVSIGAFGFFSDARARGVVGARKFSW
ncbi:hypothetical protein J4219_00870 [Candidatus Woesearchaeota archaeon]|nr:hypothetical protein [Candidatus Woesearchaeota archaeon]